MSARDKIAKLAANGTDFGAGLLLQLVHEVTTEKVVETIKAMLEATTVGRDGSEMPDWRAREAGAKLFMSYVIGLPLQRIVTQERKTEDDGATMERLLSSPAAREALKRALAVEG